MTVPLPAFAGEKSRRLFWACRKGGILKISDKFIWIFERVPPTLIEDGFVITARDFIEQAAEAFGISKRDVFTLEDEQIRSIARKIAGIAPQVARGDTYATH